MHTKISEVKVIVLNIHSSNSLSQLMFIPYIHPNIYPNANKNQVDE